MARHVEVYLRHPGDFGSVFWSGATRSEREETEMLEEMVKGIKRHINDAGIVLIVDDKD